VPLFLSDLTGAVVPQSISIKSAKRTASRKRGRFLERNGILLNYVWPLALVVLSNVFYQISAKSLPEGINPFASLTLTYMVAALTSLILYYALGKSPNILNEYSKANWVPFVLGVSIVGLEVGYIYAYKAGWPVSTAQIVQAAALAVVLIFVGNLLYKESLTWNKLAGIIVCLFGLGLINLK